MSYGMLLRAAIPVRLGDVMKATRFLVCPTCHLVCWQESIEAISNTTETAQRPCLRCQRTEERRRARLHAESEQLLDAAQSRRYPQT